MGSEIKARPDLKVIKPGEVKEILKPGEVGATIELVVRDRDGKITDHRGPMRSESFVRQFLELLWIQMYQIETVLPYSMKDTGNVARDIQESGFNFAADAGVGVVIQGIIVGTGAVAVDIDDYVLGTPIAHGVAGGELQYGAVAFGAPASDATTSQFTITRDFANGSGGGITVNEIAVYVKAKEDVTDRYFMTIRDVIGGGILVPNGQTLTVNYRPQAAI
ncbi:hypothetical protein ES708_05916 [subsurface metagenome]